MDVVDKVWNLVERAQKKNLSGSEDKAKHDSLDDLKKVLEVFGQAKELFTPEPPAAVAVSADANLWERVAVNLSTQVSSLVNSVPAIITAFKFKPGLPPQASAAATASPSVALAAAFDPYANPSALRDHSRAVNGQASGQAVHSVGAVPPANQPANPFEPSPIITPPPGDTQILLLLQNYGGLIVNALNNGTPGYDFADSVTRLVGTVTHATIANQGEGVLCQCMLSVPELALFGEARLRRFANEFVHYEEFLESEEAEDEPIRSEGKRERVGPDAP